MKEEATEAQLNVLKRIAELSKPKVEKRPIYLTTRPITVEIKIPRNAICTCGSGKKFKKCCINN